MKLEGSKLLVHTKVNVAPGHLKFSSDVQENRPVRLPPVLSIHPITLFKRSLFLFNFKVVQWLLDRVFLDWVISRVKRILMSMNKFAELVKYLSL